MLSPCCEHYEVITDKTSAIIQMLGLKAAGMRVSTLRGYL